jgi:hypothetical protein
VDGAGLNLTSRRTVKTMPSQPLFWIAGFFSVPYFFCKIELFIIKFLRSKRARNLRFSAQLKAHAIQRTSKPYGHARTVTRNGKHHRASSPRRRVRTSSAARNPISPRNISPPPRLALSPYRHSPRQLPTLIHRHPCRARRLAAPRPNPDAAVRGLESLAPRP